MSQPLPPHHTPLPPTPDTPADALLTALETDETAPREMRWTRRYLGRRYLRRRWKLLAGLGIIIAFYIVALLANFIAPYSAGAQSRSEPSAPPSAIRFRDAPGRWHARPFIHRQRLTDALARTYTEDASAAYPLALFTRGEPYKLFGLFATDRHLFGVAPAAGITPGALPNSEPPVTANAPKPPRVYLLGTDAQGRDRLSRLLSASRFSLVVGPLGTLFAGLLGVVLGCVSGYAGRRVDALLMRAADAMLALPDLVLILAVRAAFPLVLPPVRAGALLVAIFVAIGWAEMARLARGQVLQLREREFVQAAVSLGLSETRILFRHILPNAARPLVVQLSLMLPAFLLAETALSFLGVGVMEPDASWGNMLAAANNLTLLRQQPFVLLAPAIAIFLFVLAVRLVSDGLRDGDQRRAG